VEIIELGACVDCPFAVAKKDWYEHELGRESREFLRGTA
jgi:hypothetical protein